MIQSASIHRMGDTASAPTLAAYELIDSLYADSTAQTALAAQEGRLDKIRTFAQTVFLTQGIVHEFEMTGVEKRDAIPWSGRRLSGLGDAFQRGSLSSMKPSRMPARMGQLYNTTFSNQYNGVVSVFEAATANGLSPYDAFVAYVLAEKPANVTWAADAYQVNEALKTIEDNYAQQQSFSDAAAWGVRFPDDMIGDIAFKRMRLAAPEYEEAFLGHWKNVTKYFNPDAPAAQDAMATLGTKWGRFQWNLDNGAFDWVQTLTGASDSLELWYDHVFRALSVWVPAMAIRYKALGKNPADVYMDFAVPNLQNPRRFPVWVIATSTFQFDRFNGPNAPGDQALRDCLPDGDLNVIKEGFRFAGMLNNADLYFLHLIDVSIKKELAFFGSIEYILKILRLPVTVLQAAGNLLVNGNLGDLPWPKIPWYVWAGLGVFGLVATYAALK